MGPFANQLKQVSLTYLTRRWFSALAVIMLVWFAFHLRHEYGSRRGSVDLPGIFMALPALLSVFLVAQAKEQFAHVRAVMLPRFAKAHTVVLGTLLVLAVILWPVAFSGAVGWSTVGSVAMSAAVAATGIWGLHRNSILGIVPCAIFFSSLIPGVGEWWMSTARSAQLAHALILICGCAAIAAWLLRLTRLREESDDYVNAFNAAIGQKRIGSETSERRRLVAWAIDRRQLLSWVADKWHARLGGYHRGSLRRIARTLKYGGSAAPPEYSALMFILALSAFAVSWIWITSFFVRSPEQMERFNIGIWHYIMVFPSLSGCLAGLALAERRARITGEVLYPLPRQLYFDGLLLSVAWQTFVNWSFVVLGMGILGNYLYGFTFLSGASTHVLLSASVAAAGFSVALHIAAWNSFFLRLFASGLSMIAGGVPLAIWWNYRDDVGEWPFVIAALLIAAVSAGIIWLARARWWSLELG